MSRQLLLLALGPVQELIGQARRTRDLWFGSALLCEMSRAAARSLVQPDSGWRLISPALDERDRELELCKGTRRPDGSQPLGIGNKIVAVSKEGITPVDPEQAAERARLEAFDTWKVFAKQARQRAGSLLASDLAPHEKPETVIESLLEFYAAWTTYSSDADFELARREAEEAIAGRKTLRDFRAWKGGEFRKSSLDGQRESVLRDRASYRGPRTARLDPRLRIAAREHLDGVGFVKRAGGEPEQFVSVARIAIEPWLRAAYGRPRLLGRLRDLEVLCADAGVSGCEPGVTSWLHRGNFLRDGEVFFEGQWPALAKELGSDIRRLVRPFFAGGRDGLRLPEPNPYIACLSADGDRMGRALSQLATADDQRKLSSQLASFSKRTREIVERHYGVLIFAGGDDILALLPVVHAVDCAEALRAVFVEEMRSIFAEHSDGDELSPTLSVGIGVAHFLTPLGQILSLARAAEVYAKSGDDLPPEDDAARNALAVIVDKRSGGTSRWRAQWAEGDAPGKRLSLLIDLLVDGRMPGKLPYELEAAARALREEEDDNLGIGRAVLHEVRRIIEHKRPGDEHRRRRAGRS